MEGVADRPFEDLFCLLREVDKEFFDCLRGERMVRAVTLSSKE